jgi:pilus assembly protein FimV
VATIVKESVVRNLTKTIVVASILAPASVFPLGIGDIKLHSALNQKLDAEIALILSANENVSEIKVMLAPAEKFDEAGIPWSYFLSKIKFNSIVRADGSIIVKLSSDEALREPFLDFLLEVSWNKGNLYREFTVLVDPPVAYTQPVIPVVKKAESVDVAVPALIPQPLPLSQLEPKLAVVSEIVVEPVESNADYGPTNRSDSLWKVAKRTNAYNDVSIEQMMMAIYEANQKSFFKDNVNALMEGKTLDIPEREVILKLSHKQALAEFKRHNNVWKGRVVAKAKKKMPEVKQAVAGEAKPKVEEINAQLELEAPVEAEIVETAVVVAEDGAGVSNQATSKAEKGLASASEETLALQARLEKLEQQLVMMQKMLVLKDEQLAALQSQVKSTTVPKIQTIAEQTAATTKKVEPIQQKSPIAETKPVVRPEPVKPKTAEKPKPVPQPKPEEGFLSNSLSLAIAGIGIAILAVLGLFLWRKRKTEIETDTESMFATASEISLPDSEVGNLTTPPAGETTAYDVGTVGESSFLSEFTPSDFDAFDTDQNEVDPISEADVYLAYGRYQQAEDLMRQAIEDQPERDECKLKLLEIFYANENKSSFGEFATELVNSGKHNDQEFWSKVVEMGVELDPTSTLYTANAGEQKNVETEQALTPEKTVSTEQDEANFDLSVFDQDVTESDLELGAGADNQGGLDFDLSVFDLDGETATQIEKPEESTEEIKSIDFDLGPTATDETELTEESTKSGDTAVDKEIESIAFEGASEASAAENSNAPIDLAESTFELDDETVTQTEKPEGSAEEFESIDFDLAPTATDETELTEESTKSIDTTVDKEIESVDFEVVSEAPVSESVSDSLEADEQSVTEESSSIEEFDFDFDPPDSDSVDEALGAEPANDVSDLTDMDELETKIDLAKAYIDMGDADAAKGIVKEVLEKGSEEQKIAAQAVIDQLE